MRNEFVPYTESLALKELGFNEPCLGLYREDGSFLYADVFSFREPYSPSEFKEGVDEGVYYINSEILEELVTVPTFSQAFRWFREKYNLDSEIYMNYSLDSKYNNSTKLYIYLILQLNTTIISYLSKSVERFVKYEDTELACLRELIEIVKNKNNG